jgi:hypothetical protein
MTHIQLIVTGRMEELALHRSLSAVFPPDINGEAIVWKTPQYISGATSDRLLELPPEPRPYKGRKMLALAEAMIAEAMDGKSGTPADLIVVVDDVELHNFGREPIIAAHFRAAVEQQIHNRYFGNALIDCQTVLREKCSFHLLKPMVEAYLFGDADALHVAGVPSGIQPMLAHTDVEEFETNNPAYLPSCHQKNVKMQQKGMHWWQEQRHAKHYLDYLIGQGGGFYEETKHGKNALLALNWHHVPTQPADMPIFRSLFHDIANGLGIRNPVSGITSP